MDRDDWVVIGNGDGVSIWSRWIVKTELQHVMCDCRIVLVYFYFDGCKDDEGVVINRWVGYEVGKYIRISEMVPINNVYVVVIYMNEYKYRKKFRLCSYPDSYLVGV